MNKISKNAKNSIIVGIVIICIVALVIGILIHFGKKNEEAALTEALTQDWWKFEEVSGTLCVLILDFSEKEIDYIASDFDNETVIDTVAFEVVSENQFFIKDYNTVFSVSFSEDGKQMTVSPGLTSTSEEEIWSIMARPYGSEE